MTRGGQQVLEAAAMGALAAVPIARAPRGVRRSIALGSGLVTGGTAVAALVLSSESPTADQAPAGGTAGPAGKPALTPRRLATVAAIGVALTAGIAALTELGFAADRHAESALRRRGVRRPRLAIGAAVAAASLIAAPVTAE